MLAHKSLQIQQLFPRHCLLAVGVSNAQTIEIYATRYAVAKIVEAVPIYWTTARFAAREDARQRPDNLAGHRENGDFIINETVRAVLLKIKSSVVGERVGIIEQIINLELPEILKVAASSLELLRLSHAFNLRVCVPSLSSGS